MVQQGVRLPRERASRRARRRSAQLRGALHIDAAVSPRIGDRRGQHRDHYRIGIGTDTVRDVEHVGVRAVGKRPQVNDRVRTDISSLDIGPLVGARTLAGGRVQYDRHIRAFHAVRPGIGHYRVQRSDHDGAGDLAIVEVRHRDLIGPGQHRIDVFIAGSEPIGADPFHRIARNSAGDRNGDRTIARRIAACRYNGVREHGQRRRLRDAIADGGIAAHGIRDGDRPIVRAKLTDRGSALSAAGFRGPDVSEVAYAADHGQVDAAITGPVADHLLHGGHGRDRHERSDGEGVSGIASRTIGDRHRPIPGAQPAHLLGALTGRVARLPIVGVPGPRSTRRRHRRAAVAGAVTAFAKEGEVRFDRRACRHCERCCQRTAVRVRDRHDVIASAEPEHILHVLIEHTTIGTRPSDRIGRYAPGHIHVGRGHAIIEADIVRMCQVHREDRWIGEGEREGGVAAVGVGDGHAPCIRTEAGHGVGALPHVRLRRPLIGQGAGAALAHHGDAAIARTVAGNGHHHGRCGDRRRRKDEHILGDRASRLVGDRHGIRARAQIDHVRGALRRARAQYPLVFIATGPTRGTDRGRAVAITRASHWCGA